jgi:hypothetical protein
MLLVSQKLMPKSNACLKNGWLCSSFKAHAWLLGRITVGTSPYDIHPRQMRETFSPVFPRFTYSMLMLRLFLVGFVIQFRSALKGRGFSRVVIGDKENATLVAEGIFPCEYYPSFDAANWQMLR